MPETFDRLKAALADRYAIERELGAGGMATVYLAEDLKHHRKVAVKVLRPELSAVIGAERFLREIRIAAKLNHPHILQLYDSGHAEGLLFYVMPYVEGESLRAHLEREKELGIDEAIQITQQVASALEYAHRQGIIHRDIKPENILLHEGEAMVTDFGIALALRVAGGERLTETGLSLGTPQYMSPEQATGERELDARSDIYSLASVLYEMLAGEAPYTGPTVQAIIAKVLTEKAPDVRALRDSVPPHLGRAVAKALAKLPADRFHAAAEFSEALVRPGAAWAPEEVAAARPGTTTVPVPVPAIKSRAQLTWPVVAILATIAAIWGWLRPTSTPAPPGVLARFVVTLPSSQQLAEAPGRFVAVSPDGSRLVYVGISTDGRQLYERALDQLSARPIPGTEGATNPFFSHDGQWVGFNVDAELKRVALAGGAALTVTDSTFVGGYWGADDVVTFTGRNPVGLYQIPASGGTPQLITTADTAQGEFAHAWPQLLPGGKALLFTSISRGPPRIGVASLETGEITYLAEGIQPRYVETGHLVFARAGGSLMAAPFDLDRLEMTGPAVQMLEGVGIGGSTANFDVSRNGTLVYLARSDDNRSLVLVDRQGRERPLTDEPRSYDGPRFSPDGNRMAYRVAGANFHIWVRHLQQGTSFRLTFDGANYYPEWTPDGTRVAFIGDRGAGPDLYWKTADGTGSAEPILTAAQAQWDITWMPDGNQLVFRQNDSTTGRDLWTLRLDGDRTPEPLLTTRSEERAPRLSPDGRYLAYVSNESGRAEVYVRTFPDTSGKWQVSTDGGTEPLWAPSGRELFYRNADAVIAVAIQTQPGFRVGTEQTLFSGAYVPNPMHTNYDIHPDGEQFVMVRSAEGETRLNVVLNWFAELQRHAGSSIGGS